MTDLAGLAVQAVALKVLGDRVSEQAAAVKTDLAAELAVGDRKTARLADGTEVGSVTYVHGSSGSPRVVDAQRFTAWVAENYPDEITAIVRPGFQSALLGRLDGDVDVLTGEVVPGVQMGGGGRPYVAAKLKAGALPALLAAIHANQALALGASGIDVFADPDDGTMFGGETS